MFDYIIREKYDNQSLFAVIMKLHVQLICIPIDGNEILGLIQGKSVFVLDYSERRV